MITNSLFFNIDRIRISTLDYIASAKVLFQPFPARTTSSGWYEPTEFPLVHTSHITIAATLLALALLVNIPLGYLREASQKFSVRWFVFVHLSIPLLVALRVTVGLGWGFVPLSIASAVAGQVIGGRINRRKGA